MTKEEKKERRKLKAELVNRFMANHFKQGLYTMTENQLKQAAKKVADQIVAGKNPQFAEEKGDNRGEGLVQVW